MQAFCCGLPGWMYLSWIPAFSAQAVMVEPMYSGPLSHLISDGFPRHSMICCSALMIRSQGREKSTSMPSTSVTADEKLTHLPK